MRSSLILAFALASGALPSLAASPTAFPPAAFSVAWPGAASSPSPTSAEAQFAPAPVPDMDLAPPSSRAPRTSQAELSPRVYGSRLPPTYRGDGYTPGSTSDDEQARRQRLQQLAPGFALSVPLQ
jgi:hypothetical protein